MNHISTDYTLQIRPSKSSTEVRFRKLRLPRHFPGIGTWREARVVYDSIFIFSLFSILVTE